MPPLTAPLKAYRSSLSLARRIRALPSDTSAADAFSFNQREGTIAADQKPEEIVWLLEFLRGKPPKVVLEIGTKHGGSLFLFARVAAEDALLVSLDRSKMIGRLGRWSPYALVRHAFARAGQRITLIEDVDSQDDRTVARVLEELGGRPVDFLFIDGDHRYEGVSRDFELYSPLVRRGGLIAFHDISPRSTPTTEGVARFWAELKGRGETFERIADGDSGYGIGIYRTPS